jgi:ATP-dependent helicase HrpB
MPRPQPLPIDPHLPRALELLERSHRLVLQAEPGTGKTTRLPPALLRSPFVRSGEILVLEPRRLAAKMAARRVADELGEPVGRTVGYQFRFENVGGAETRLRFLTEGMLMKRLLSDPQLEGVAAVCLDEFHERHLQGDLALAMLKRLQDSARPDLRIVVMSATLDTEAVSAFLGGCPVLSVPGKRFEVAVEYLPRAPERPLERAVRDAVERLLEEDGDVLVFLPGMAEIRRAEEVLQDLARAARLRVLPLHGELTREEQDAAVGPSDRRKVILSTNVAETSLTIPGVTAVVDSGLARVASHSYWSGLPSLTTRAISRASAIQRAGRAGRLAPGRCLRLYGKGDFEGRAPFELPEVQRADLAPTVLELHALGVADPAGFAWFEAPPPGALSAAERLLELLGAVQPAETGGARITELGRRLVEAPVHPRLGRMVLEGARLGAGRECACLAAYVSEARGARVAGGHDLIAGFERAHLDGPAKKLAERLENVVKHGGGGPGQRGGDVPLRRALLAGFPDRVAQRRAGRHAQRREVELVLSSGGSATTDESALTATHEYFVAVDVEEKKQLHQTRAVTRATWIAAIEADWLLDVAGGLAEARELQWNASAQRVEAVERLAYGELVVSESRARPAASEAAAAGRLLAERLLEPGADEGIARLSGREEWELFSKRWRFLAARAPELGMPALDDAFIRSALAEFCDGKLSATEVREGGYLAFLMLKLGPVAPKFDRLAPTHLTLARNRRAKIHYELDQPPWVESRLQDFFGLKQGPAVLDGRVPLTLHLLAPNQRAVQVTSDLAGFWVKHYPQLRKELGRRYPRHAWPEDPLAPS